ncbi:MAG: DUF6519 domain-containing protein, partial [Acidobacteriota bacterium]|nr:DUF6519 domain-containing protein [Acidobacteriota bacterium]
TKARARKAVPRVVVGGHAFGASSKILTLDIDVSRVAFNDLRLRQVGATYKWSRENGSVVTAITDFSKDDPEITVHDLGPDDALGFGEGQWAEIIDDGLELNGQPGQLVQIVKVDAALNLITLNVKPSPLTGNPKLRRWDGVGTVKYYPDTVVDHFLGLESGVQVRFLPGSFKTGDYWNIPARTATADAQSGNIEWPQDAGGPAALPPFGIQHHYCRLALLRWDGNNFAESEDCRNLFPNVTELTSLFYVSGDGQEAMPNNPLPHPLQAGVFNGRTPVAGAPVRFTTQKGGLLAITRDGLASAGAKETLIVVAGSSGVANCFWKLDPGASPSQQVEARLLDINPIDLSLLDPNITPLPPVVRFNGNLSIASQVAYTPGDCASLQNRTNVQDALARLSQLTSLYKVSGDGQEVVPGDPPITLKAVVANSCGPITNKELEVTFSVVKPHRDTFIGVVRAEGGRDSDVAHVKVGADGLWTCLWTPDPTVPFQEVEAKIEGDGTVPPVTVRFSANVSLASHVAYSPDAMCATLKARNTVQKAIDQLSHLVSLYEVSGNDQVVMPQKPLAQLTVLAANACGPAGGQAVKFEVMAGSGKVSPIEPVITGADGIATATWTLDSSMPAQQVKASLVDNSPPSVTPPTSVLFTANLSVASNVAYTPNAEQCPDLSQVKVTNVQEALDALCKRAPESDSGVRITNVLTGDGRKLRNDTLVMVARLAGGFMVNCDGAITLKCFGPPPPDPASKFPNQPAREKPTCFLALDLPYPLGEEARLWEFAPGKFFGFRSLIVAGSVRVEENTILWTPTQDANTWLQTKLFQRLSTLEVADRILARLTLKGNFVWSQNTADTNFLYLDGDAFGTLSSTGRTDLILPTGDGRKGGDFEMWF